MNVEHDDNNFARMQAEAQRYTKYLNTDPCASPASVVLGQWSGNEYALNAIAMRIKEATGLASKTCERISIIADRVTGPVPASNDAAGLASGGSGAIAEINSALDTLFNILTSQSDEISRIENL